MAQANLSAAREPHAPDRTRELIASEAFRALVRKRWAVSSVLLVLLFVTYYGFIILVSTQKELVSQRIGEFTTLAIPLGVGAIVFAWVLTALYVVWANRSYDPEVDRLKSELRK
jgi:uncharacterized membrane protein (DUF485 family)